MTLAPKRKPRRLLLLALLALLFGTAATFLARETRGPLLGGPHRIVRRPIPPAGGPRTCAVVPAPATGASPSPGEAPVEASVTVRALRLHARTPVPGATITLRDAADLWTGIADAAGEVVVAAEAPGMAAIPVQHTLGGGSNDPVDAYLEESCAFEGVVLAATDRRPVAGAQVRLECWAPSPWWDIQPPVRGRLQMSLGTCTTDADGRFRTAVAAGLPITMLRVSAAGFVPEDRRLQERPSGGRFREQRILLLPAARIVGVVRDPEGRPVAGAAVRSSAIGDMEVKDDACVSAPDGSFALTGFPADGVYRVVARKPGYASSREGNEVYLPPDASEARVDLTLGAAGALVESWPAAAGGPGPGGVFATLRGPGDGGERSSFLDRRGPLRFEGLAAGRYRIGLFGSEAGYGTAEVEVPAGPPTEVEVALVGDTALEGVVVDAAGTPVRSMVRIALEPPGTLPGEGRFPGAPGEVLTKDDGQFRFHGLVPGTRWRLLAKMSMAHDFGAPSDPVAAPARDLRIALGPAAEVKGRLVLPTGTSPPEWMYLRYNPVGSFPGRSGPDYGRFGDGRFVLHSLAPGTWEFEAWAGSLSVGPLRVEVPGCGTDLGDLVLAPAGSGPLQGKPGESPRGTLRIQAWSAGGIPLAGREVCLGAGTPLNGRGMSWQMTDRRGRYAVTLAPGEYHIEIHSPGGAVLAAGEATVPWGGEVSVELRAKE